MQRPGQRGGYRMGPKVMTWGSSFLRAVNLIDEFHVVAAPIVGRINETMQLAVLDWPDVVFVAHVDSNRPVRLATEVGRRLPAHATAVGKALLAFSGASAAVERYRHQELRKAHSTDGRLGGGAWSGSSRKLVGAVGPRRARSRPRT